jgi:hypothetical protein
MDSAYARLLNKISAWFISQQDAVAPRSGSDLLIISARYGAGDNWADIRDLLRARIQSGKLNIDVTNESLLGGADPIFGVGKSAEVKYSYGGRTKSVTIPENQVLSLPE